MGGGKIVKETQTAAAAASQKVFFILSGSHFLLWLTVFCNAAKGLDSRCRRRRGKQGEQKQVDFVAQMIS